MCGIAGYLSKDGIIEKSRFEKMVDIISHRGPDDRGFYYDAVAALGHRRLAVIDLSKEGHQPFFYKDKYVIVFNGEIYNYIELRQELKNKGYEFATNTDTEVLVAMYDCYGKECLSRFNGMWSFAIYDIKNKSVFCSRDRFGIKPFYYCHKNGKFIFASEIKQILEVIESKPKVNIEVAKKYIISGVLDDSDNTMFSGIYKLGGGFSLQYHINKDDMKIEQYYDIRKVKPTTKNYQSVCEEFRKIFEDSIKLRLRADVPIGFCLSGGLDSSAIVCMSDRICREKKENVPRHTISSCFEDKAYDEQEYIDEVVKNTNVISHKTFPKEENLFEQLDKMIWHMDEPFASTSMYAQWNVFKATKEQGLTVMLDGQGADEQLAGYTSFYPVLFADYIKRGKFITCYKEYQAYKRLRATTEKYISSWDVFLVALGGVINTGWLISAGKKILHKYPYNLPFTKSDLKYIDGQRSRYPIGKSEKFIYDSLYVGLQSLLRYEDRNSMAFSIESRVPFLDYRLVELIYSVPMSYKIRNGITKSLMRDGLMGILPEKIRTRYSKFGFVTPEDKWIRENVEEFGAEFHRACKHISEFMDTTKLEKWYDVNAIKMKRNDFLAWRVICFGRWMDVFNL